MEIELYQFVPDIGGFLSLGLNVILPLAVGLVTTRVTSAKAKGLLLFVLSLVTTFLLRWSSAHNDALPFDFASVGINVLVTFLIGGLMHMIAWKPFGVSTWLQDVSGPGLKRHLNQLAGPVPTPGDTWGEQATQTIPAVNPDGKQHTIRVAPVPRKPDL